MNVWKIALLLLGMQVPYLAFSQFYIGYNVDFPAYDSSDVVQPGQFPAALSMPVRNMELYQDSSSNRLILVNCLKNKKIIYPVYYQVKQDTITGEDYLFLKRHKNTTVRSEDKKRVNELREYRNFIKIKAIGDSDSVFIARSADMSDGIDNLEMLWHIADRDIPCGLFIYFKQNIPRHSNVSYYHLNVDSECLNLNSESPYQEP